MSRLYRLFSIIIVFIFILVGCSDLDDTPPEINFESEFLLEYEVFSEAPNWQEAASITDNNDAFNDISISIDDSNVDMDTIGEYEVMFTVEDSEGNKASESLTIYVVDTTNPEIVGLQNISFEVGSNAPDWLSGITATDNYDGDIVLTNDNVDTANVDMNTVGTFDVVYSVADSSGNEAEEIITITITSDVTKPIFTGNNTYEVNEDTIWDPLDLVSTLNIQATDNINGSLDVYVIEDNVDINTPGVYSLIYGAEDLSENGETFEVTVTVLDITAPVIDVSGMQLTYELGSTEPNWLDGVLVTDNVDGILVLTLDNVDATSVDLNVAGTYSVIYTISDSSSNETSLTVYITVNKVWDLSNVVSDDEEVVYFRELSNNNSFVSVRKADGYYFVKLDSNENTIWEIGPYYSFNSMYWQHVFYELDDGSVIVNYKNELDQKVLLKVTTSGMETEIGVYSYIYIFDKYDDFIFLRSEEIGSSIGEGFTINKNGQINTILSSDRYRHAEDYNQIVDYLYINHETCEYIMLNDNGTIRFTVDIGFSYPIEMLASENYLLYSLNTTSDTLYRLNLEIGQIDTVADFIEIKSLEYNREYLFYKSYNNVNDVYFANVIDNDGNMIYSYGPYVDIEIYEELDNGNVVYKIKTENNQYYLLEVEIDSDIVWQSPLYDHIDDVIFNSYNNYIVMYNGDTIVNLSVDGAVLWSDTVSDVDEIAQFDSGNLVYIHIDNTNTQEGNGLPDIIYLTVVSINDGSVINSLQYESYIEAYEYLASTYYELFNNYIMHDDFMYFATFTEISTNLIVLDSLGNEIENISYNSDPILIYVNNNQVNSVYINTNIFEYEFIMFDSQANKTIELDIDIYCETLSQLDDDEFLISQFGKLYKHNIMNEYEEITTGTGYDYFWFELYVNNNGNYFKVGRKDNNNYYIEFNNNYEINEESIIINYHYDGLTEIFYVINDNVVRKVTSSEYIFPVYFDIDIL